MPVPESFQQAYQRLNAEQRLAVDTLEGPVMVSAGPGTGKTQLLTTRIAKILLETQAGPHNILALTFTNAAAKNMQQRLVEMIGVPGYAVRFATFHSFCAEVIAQHPESFLVVSGMAEAVAEVDKLMMLEKILHESDFVHIVSAKNPRFYVKACLHLISSYKREGQTPASLRLLLEAEKKRLESDELSVTEQRTLQRTVEKNQEIIELYTEYNRLLAERGQYDYDDMILWVREAFAENAELLSEYQELYQYILVDEFQDTNQAQLQVVQALASFWGEAANIFVVGDPHQSIYRFQGASFANTLSFLELYPQATVIELRTGYRCGQRLYDAAARLIANNGSPLPKSALTAYAEPLAAADGHLGKLVTHEAPDTLAECFWILQQIQVLQHQGVAFDNIAVVYRKHAHSALIQSVLERAGVPVTREGSKNLLHDPLVQQLLIFLRFLHSVPDSQESAWFFPFLRLPWLQLEPSHVLKVCRAAALSRQEKRPWDELQESFPELSQHIEQWLHGQDTLPAPRYLEKILKESGFYQYFYDHQELASLNAVASFLRELQSWYEDSPGPLRAFLDRLDVLLAHNETLTVAELQVSTSAVRLTSAHQAKGQEWPYVFLLHAHDGYWGNVRAPAGITPLPNTIPYAMLDKKERNEDERRLFYVALTRASDTVFLSWSQGAVSGERRKELLPSVFVEEIKGVQTEISAALTPEQLQQFFAAHIVAAPSWEQQLQLDREWLRELISEFSLSASALNDFLECPVGFLFKDVIRIPVQTPSAAVIGTAAHSALEFLLKKRQKTGILPPKEELLEVAHRSVEKSTLARSERARASAHVSSVLSRYYDAQSAELPQPLLLERFFGGSTPVTFEGLKLVGKVDRIDPLALPQVKVVDYKTSSPKTRNEILGKTASSDGAYWRQLVFYKLLADLDPSFSYTVTEGELVFLESNDRGIYKTERFLYEQEDVEELKNTLRQVQSKLLSLEFLDHAPCGKCEMCQLLGITAA